MSDITKIDPNLKTESVSDGTFLSIDQPPFTVYGLGKDEDGYFRFPPEIAEKVSEGVAYLNRQTAGGLVRFKTNSPTVAVSAAKPVRIDIMGHMAAMSCAGFDMYSGTHFLGGIVPPGPFGREYTGKVTLFTKDCQPDKDGFLDITMYLPTYGSYADIGIMVEEGYSIRPADSFRNQKPVVFYGSSITQGGCAASPGASFVNMISRMRNLYVVNLGFSGSAKGEPEMNEYLASLDMAAFVLDYDHNASYEQLKQTHYNVYKAVRLAHPTLPVIMASSIPTLKMDWERYERREVVRATYEKALAEGDKYVTFLDGGEFFDEVPFDFCTMDGTHPNTLGMYQMAVGFGKALADFNL